MTFLKSFVYIHSIGFVKFVLLVCIQMTGLVFEGYLSHNNCHSFAPGRFGSLRCHRTCYFTAKNSIICNYKQLILTNQCLLNFINLYSLKLNPNQPKTTISMVKNRSSSLIQIFIVAALLFSLT